MKDRYPYQEFMFQKILRRPKTAVIGKPGCGKTRPIIDATVKMGCIDLTYIGDDPKNIFPQGSIFIMCSGPAIATWLRQYPEWVGDPLLRDHIHIITGDTYKGKPARTAAWARALVEPGIYITNFTCFRYDFHLIKQIKWSAIIADEYHKVMRRNKSTTFKYFRSWTRHEKVVLLASGSVLSKQPGSMWTAFTIIEPGLKLFRSYWRYLNTYCIIEEGAYGQEIQGIKNVEGLKDIMDEYFAYVPAAVIADQQPKGVRAKLDVMMTKEQEKIYAELSKDLIAELGDSGNITIAPTHMAKLLILRQLLCCPKILDPSLGMGAGYEAILDRLDDEPHVVIFVPFRPAVQFVVDALKAKGYAAEGMKGGVGHEEQADIISRFRINRGIIVCTIAYAESFDLETCQTSYFLGYDFNVEPNEQAEGRTQRAISEHDTVFWHYICHYETVDEVMLMNLDEDNRNMSRVLKRSDVFVNALRGKHD